MDDSKNIYSMDFVFLTNLSEEMQDLEEEINDDIHEFAVKMVTKQADSTDSEETK